LKTNKILRQTLKELSREVEATVSNPLPEEKSVGEDICPGKSCSECLDGTDYACSFYDGKCILSESMKDPAAYKASKFVWMSEDCTDEDSYKKENICAGKGCGECIDDTDYACLFYDGKCIPSESMMDPADYKMSKFVWSSGDCPVAVACEDISIMDGDSTCGGLAAILGDLCDFDFGAPGAPCSCMCEIQVGATYSSHYNTLKCGDIGKLDVSGGSECASAYTAVTGQSASSTNYGGVQYISGNWAPYGCHMAYTGKSTPWLYWNSQYGDGSGFGSYQTICKTEDPDYGCGPGNPAPSGCDNKCGSTKVNDECGVCGGSGILDGKCDCSGNVVDECGVCGGEGYTNMCTWCDCQKWDEPNYSDCHQVASKADAKRYAVRCEQDGSTPMPSFWTHHDEECKKYSCNL